MGAETQNIEDTRIADRLHVAIASLVDGNHVKGSELTKGAHRACACHIRYTVDWAFEPVTTEVQRQGNAAVSTHYGFDLAAYGKETAQRSQIARTHQPIRADFISRVLAQKGAAVAQTDASINIWDFGQHSVCERCSPCYGSGTVGCSSCSSSGKTMCYYCSGHGSTSQSRWVVDHRGNGRTEYYDQACYHCGHSGKLNCSSCNGHGKLQCGQCGGEGFFTNIMSTVVKARPAVRIGVNADLSAQALSDYLCQQPAERIAQHLNFALQDHSDVDQQTWRTVYEASTTVVELELALRKKIYSAAAVGEHALAFIRPPIFDEIFIEEITDLKKIWSGKKQGFSARRARQFFATYAGQPVLDAAMKAVAQLPGEKRKHCEQPVIAACQGYISASSATVLGQSMLALLDKVSPPNSPWSWWLVMALPFALLFVVAQRVLELHGVDRMWTLISDLLWLGAGAVILTLLISPLAVLVSTMISALRRRSVPREYRQRGRNWQPLKRFVRIALLVTGLGAGYGALAQKNLLPRWNNMPLEFLAHFVQQPGQTLAAMQNMLGIETAAQKEEQKEELQRQSRRLRILDMQKNLQLLGYRLKETGELDTATRNAVAAYGKKRKMKNPDYEAVQLALCQELKQRCSNDSNTPMP